MATEAEIPETATKSSELEVPEETLAPNTLGVLAPESGNLTKEEKEEQNSGNGATNSTEKKIRRAERFGVPLQLSEEEKRNSRAQRFGTLSGSDALKSSEELKRKARTERFGPVANSTVDTEAKKNSAVDNEAKKNSAVDNEAKKKARLARFGSNAKIDSQEEEKRKARALRFAQPAPDSQAKTDCKGDVELATQKTAVTGSTIGGA